MSTIYSLKNTVKQYNGRIVLDIAQLDIQAGEILALVGPSGAGKSTLLRLLAFLEEQTTGELLFNGRLCTPTFPDLETRRQVTMVFQHPQLLKQSLYDNVRFGLRLRGDKSESARVTAVIEQLGLGELVNATASTLSGGETQRVALARALVLQPKVLLLDEPTANLDPYNIKLIEQIVRDANQATGTTVIIVTHNIFQARRLADRVGLILNGKLVEISDTETFFENPQRPETAAFVRGDMVY